MKKKPDRFDFWYAVRNTEIVAMPLRTLETFGTTMLNYHLISELMDTVNQVRVREGRIEAYRPQIIAPESYAEGVLEGEFGEEAERYVEWMRKNVRFLRYGFKVKKEEFSEHILSESIRTVAERVAAEVKTRNDPFSAVVVGVDNPWQVCLLELLRGVVEKSCPANVMDMERRQLFGETDGVPNVVRDEIETAFAAAKSTVRLDALAKKLQRYGLFEKYQDRFFELVRAVKATE